MDGFLTRFLAGEIFSDPLVSKLFLLVIFFLGAAQAVRIIHSFWKNGKLKTQEKQVKEEKGQWKQVMEDVLAELKIRNARADKIYDMVQWLHEVHNKFDDDGVPLWYVRKSDARAMEKAIESLAGSATKQVEILEKISEHQYKQDRHLEKIGDRLPRKK